MPEAESTRIGDLLTLAKVLRKEDLEEAIQIAMDTGQMIGKVLVMSGYLSRHSLQVALDAQSRIRDQVLDYDFGIQAIGYAAKQGISLDQGLKRLGWTPQVNKETAKLGELLGSANLLSHNQLQAALNLAQESGQPLGRCLISMNCLTEDQVLLALNQQSAVRQGLVSKEQAIKNIAASKKATSS